MKTLYGDERSGRLPIHLHVKGTNRTACGLTERDPMKPTVIDPETRRPERKPPSIALTFYANRSTCPACVGGGK